MSMLNDALKRASQSQQEHDTVRIHLVPATAPVRPPAPAPEPESAPEPKPGTGWTLPIIVVLLAVACGAFIIKAHFPKQRRHPAQIVRTVPVSQPVRPAPAPPKPAPAPAQAAPQTAAADEPELLPPLKVQGISYYNAKWQAIVNGKTVNVGDIVNGFRVALISRYDVSFIAPDGSKKTMYLGE